MLCPAPPCIHAPSPAEGTLYHQRVCALCGPALFCAFVIPDQFSCCLPPVIVMQPRAWRVVMSGGYGPCHDERCALKPMHPSLHYCLCIHEHVPPMPSCAQVPLPSAAHPRYRRTTSTARATSRARRRGSGVTTPPALVVDQAVWTGRLAMQKAPSREARQKKLSNFRILG